MGEILKDNKELNEMRNELEKITRDLKEEELRDELSRIKAVYMKGIREGIQKGLEKGIKKGKEEGFKEGKQIGLKEGIKKGIEKGFIEKEKQIVFNMYRQKVKTEDICKFMKLTTDEVDDIILSL